MARKFQEQVRALEKRVQCVVTDFQRYIGYGRTMNPEKIKLWKIPTSNSIAVESFKEKTDFLQSFDPNDRQFNLFQHNTIIRCLREASHCYPGMALECGFFKHCISSQLERALLRQLWNFVTGEL